MIRSNVPAGYRPKGKPAPVVFSRTALGANGAMPVSAANAHAYLGWRSPQPLPPEHHHLGTTAHDGSSLRALLSPRLVRHSATRGSNIALG